MDTGGDCDDISEFIFQRQFLFLLNQMQCSCRAYYFRRQCHGIENVLMISWSALSSGIASFAAYGNSDDCIAARGYI